MPVFPARVVSPTKAWIVTGQFGTGTFAATSGSVWQRFEAWPLVMADKQQVGDTQVTHTAFGVFDDSPYITVRDGVAADRRARAAMVRSLM